MIELTRHSLVVALLLMGLTTWAQTDSLNFNEDSANVVLLMEYNKKLTDIEQQHVADSIKKADLEIQLNALKTTDNLQK